MWVHGAVAGSARPRMTSTFAPSARLRMDTVRRTLPPAPGPIMASNRRTRAAANPAPAPACSASWRTATACCTCARGGRRWTLWASAACCATAGCWTTGSHCCRYELMLPSPTRNSITASAQLVTARILDGVAGSELNRLKPRDWTRHLVQPKTVRFTVETLCAPPGLCIRAPCLDIHVYVHPADSGGPLIVLWRSQADIIFTRADAAADTSTIAHVRAPRRRADQGFGWLQSTWVAWLIGQEHMHAWLHLECR